MNDALLRAEKIAKWYPMGRTRLEVLMDCTLHVRKGEFLAIMGRSGSGKSTLLHVLGALDVPQQGDVMLEDQPVFAPVGERRMRTGISDVFSPAERRRNHLRRTRFGFIFQFYHLLPELSVLENVLMPQMIDCSMFEWAARKPAAREHARALLDKLGLRERMKHKPNELSGGERQRVAIARALMNKPAILLADEPTGNLDAESGANILSILNSLHEEGQTIVMVTHDLSLAQQADRLLRLERGRLVDN